MHSFSTSGLQDVPVAIKALVSAPFAVKVDKALLRWEVFHGNKLAA